MHQIQAKFESDPVDLVEKSLDFFLPTGEPEALHRAMRYVIFSGGKRVRPRLLLAVANACKTLRPEEITLAVNAACAVEFIHNASLVHDDLPAFDDAKERRGRPTVHMKHGEPIAVLVGDALLTRAFEILAADVPPELAGRALRIVRLLGMLTGSEHGIIGGQSLESPQSSASFNDDQSTVERYHVMKTGALFRFAAEAGALAAGVTDTSAWTEFGHNLGLAYQLGDDLIDTYGNKAAAGKPVGRDAELGRPNAVIVLGEAMARRRLSQLLNKTLGLARSLVSAPGPLIALVDELSGTVHRTSR